MATISHKWDAQQLRLGILAVTVLGALFLGWSVGNASWQRMVLLALPLVPIAAVTLGEVRFAAITIVVIPLPLFSQSLGLPLTWFAVAILVVLVVFDRLGRAERRVPRGRIGRVDVLLPLAFYASAILADVLGNEGAVTSRTAQVFAIGVGVAFYLCLLTLIRDDQVLKRMLEAFVLGALVVVGMSVLQVWGHVPLPGMLSLSGVATVTETYGQSVRVAGVMGDYELAAEFLALAAIAGTYLASRSKGPMQVAWIAAVTACLVGVLVTGTRGGVFLALLGFALLLFRQRRMTAYNSIGLVVVAVAAVVGFQAEYFTQTGGIVQRLSSTVIKGSLAETFNRASVWPVFTPRKLLDSALIVGHGAEFAFGQWGTYPHSLYLYLLHTQGIIGLCLFGAMLVLGVAPLRKLLSSEARWSSETVLALLVLLFAVDEVKIEYTRLYNYQLVVWSLLAMAAASRAIAAARSEK